MNLTNYEKETIITFNDDEKIAVVFPKLNIETYIERNLKRQTEENKFIPSGVIEDMISRWEDVSYDEGFDKIINLFSFFGSEYTQ